MWILKADADKTKTEQEVTLSYFIKFKAVRIHYIILGLWQKYITLNYVINLSKVWNVLNPKNLLKHTLP